LTRRRLDLGARGEEARRGWYAAQGYAVLDRNWRCRDGELDLVVSRGTTLVFCEVKTRTGDGFGSRPRRWNGRKQAAPATAAAAMAGRPARPGGWPDLRFDVACVTCPFGGQEQLEVIEAAF